MTVDIQLRKRAIAFEETKGSGASDAAEVELHSEVLPSRSSSETSSLRLQVSKKNPDELKSGSVAMLVLKLLDGAPVGEILKLPTRTEAAAVNADSKAAPIASAGSEIDVVQVSALFTRFFYMHIYTDAYA